MKKRSWKTSVGGALVAALGILKLFDGGEIDPETIAQIVAGVTLLFARDGNPVAVEE